MRKLYSMMALVQISATDRSSKISSFWPTVKVARLCCERETGETLQFKAVSVGTWEVQLEATFYRIALSPLFGEWALFTATALLED